MGGKAFLGSVVALAISCSCGKSTSARESVAGESLALQANGLEVRTLYDGSLEAPLAALVLSDEPGVEPTVLFHDPSGDVAARSPSERIAEDDAISVSRDWRRFLRSSFDGEKTTLHFAHERVLAGQSFVALDSAGRTSVARSTLVDEPGLPRLWMGGQDGNPILDQTVGGLRWVEVAAGGERLAYGTREQTLVLDREGREVARLPASELGALSREGTWLAQDQELPIKRRFTLTRLVPPAAKSFDLAQQAVSVVFDRDARRTARVSPSAVQTFRLDADAPELEFERAAPAGQAWRSAAYDSRGRLALGRIEIMQRPRRVPEEPPVSDVPGSARISVELFEPGAEQASAHATWEVENWNYRSPELAFGSGGRLFAIVWPKAFEVLLP